MKELRFQTYTSVQLPSGNYLFFPSLEDRSAADGKIESATIVAYDHPAYFAGALVGGALHLAVEEGLFGRLARDLCERDLQQKPVLIEYEASAEGELLRLVIDRDNVQSYIGQLGGAPPAPVQPAPGQRAKG